MQRAAPGHRNLQQLGLRRVGQIQHPLRSVQPVAKLDPVVEPGVLHPDRKPVSGKTQTHLGSGIVKSRRRPL